MTEILKKWGIAFLIAFSLIFLFNKFIFKVVRTSDINMSSSINEGDYVFISKLSSIKKYDVVYAEHPETGEMCMYRVVGTSGDIIEIYEGNLIVNNKKILFKSQKNLYSFIDFENGKNLMTTINLNFSELKKLKSKNEYVIRKIINSKDYYLTDSLNKTKINPDYYPKTKIPEGHFFLLNDNRSNYDDSRIFSSVTKDKIYGKAIWVLFPSIRKVK